MIHQSRMLTLFATALMALCACANEADQSPNKSGEETNDAAENTVPEPMPAKQNDLTKVKNFEWSEFTLKVAYKDAAPYEASGILVATDWIAARFASVGPPISLSDDQTSKEVDAALEEFATFDDVIAAYPTGLIVNAGLLAPPQQKGGMPDRHAGLSYMNGILISSLNDKISGLVCLTSEHQQIAMYQTRIFQENPERIRDQCSSAFQAYPVVISSGNVDINATEVGRTNPRKRIISAISRSDRRFYLIMKDPIHLLPIADFLSKGDTDKVKLASATNEEMIQKYVRGVKGAINLPSAKAAIAVADEQYLTDGDVDTVRSVLIFDPPPD